MLLCLSLAFIVHCGCSLNGQVDDIESGLRAIASVGASALNVRSNASGNGQSMIWTLVQRLLTALFNLRKFLPIGNGSNANEVEIVPLKKSDCFLLSCGEVNFNFLYPKLPLDIMLVILQFIIQIESHLSKHRPTVHYLDAFLRFERIYSVQSYSIVSGAVLERVNELDAELEILRRNPEVDIFPLLDDRMYLFYEMGCGLVPIIQCQSVTKMFKMLKYFFDSSKRNTLGQRLIMTFVQNILSCPYRAVLAQECVVEMFRFVAKNCVHFDVVLKFLKQIPENILPKLNCWLNISSPFITLSEYYLNSDILSADELDQLIDLFNFVPRTIPNSATVSKVSFREQYLQLIDKLKLSEHSRSKLILFTLVRYGNLHDFGVFSAGILGAMFSEFACNVRIKDLVYFIWMRKDRQDIWNVIREKVKNWHPAALIAFNPSQCFKSVFVHKSQKPQPLAFFGDPREVCELLPLEEFENPLMQAALKFIALPLEDVAPFQFTLLIYLMELAHKRGKKEIFTSLATFIVQSVCCCSKLLGCLHIIPKLSKIWTGQFARMLFNHLASLPNFRNNESIERAIHNILIVALEEGDQVDLISKMRRYERFRCMLDRLVYDIPPRLMFRFFEALRYNWNDLHLALCNKSSDKYLKACFNTARESFLTNEYRARYFSFWFYFWQSDRNAFIEHVDPEIVAFFTK